MAALKFSDQTECCEAIANALASAVKPPWRRIVVHASLNGIQVTLQKQYESEHGILADVPFIPTLGECFYALARLVSNQDKGLFKTCVFTLTPDEFDVQYVY